jgi:hypothetical protein
MPRYTLIRMNASPTNKNWYETNLPQPDDPETGGKPRWAVQISQKLEISAPEGMHMADGLEDDDESDKSGDDGGSDDEAMLGLDDDEDDEDGAEVPQVAEVYPYRFCLFGLAISPGGGATALLASIHSTRYPERGGWQSLRSAVYFDYHEPPVLPPNKNPTRRETISDDIMARNLSIEGRLFEWLYGGGPDVPGVTVAQKATGEDAGAEQMKELFRPAEERQTCDLCGSKMAKKGVLSVCGNGHFVGTCGTSGLAIQMPGITRSCGACGSRTIRADLLVEKLSERRDEVMKALGNGVCGSCGGKFLV